MYLIFYIAPATVSYYFLNFRFSLKNISEYVKYIYEYNTSEWIISWVGGPYLLNIICIIHILIYFLQKRIDDFPRGFIIYTICIIKNNDEYMLIFYLYIRFSRDVSFFI